MRGRRCVSLTRAYYSFAGVGLKGGLMSKANVIHWFAILKSPSNDGLFFIQVI